MNLFEKFKEVNYKYFLWLGSAAIVLIVLLFLIFSSINLMNIGNQKVYAYTIKVHDMVEKLDMIFERAELNVNVMSDTIATSYNVNKLNDKAYNMHYIEDIDSLVKSALANSPNVNGSWFQLNADLPFSVHAYNWYEFKENQFINVKEQFDDPSSIDRKITPEDDPYYFDAVNNEKPTWSNIYIDADTKTKMMTLSSPVYKDGTLVGVVGIDISIENLQNTLQNMQAVLGRSDLYLLDKNGRVILAQTDENSSSVDNSYAFLDKFKDNGEGPIEYSEYFKKKTSIKLTLSNGYNVVISVLNDTLFKDVNQILNIVYGLFILLIISIIVIFVNLFKLMKN